MKAKPFLFIFMMLVISAIASPGKRNIKQSSAFLDAASYAGDISFLRTHRQGKGVSIEWAVTSSDGVTGFIVQRTYGDPNDPYSMWDNVSSTSCNLSRSYKCNDEDVFPGFLSYRVVIVMANGSKAVSAISTVHIMRRHG